MAYQSAFSCHVGPVEVIKNFFCGSMDEALDMASGRIRVDTLIPLDALEAAVWDLGFRGEILYYPIKDYGILPDDVLNALVTKILDRLGRGKKVGLFCMGGHGRTGYVASIVLGKLGYEDPIGFLRSIYCSQAIESNAQIRHIAKVLGKPELARTYTVQNRLIDDLRYSSFDDYDFFTEYFPAGTENFTCRNCVHSTAGICQVYKVPIGEDDDACEYFSKK